MTNKRIDELESELTALRGAVRRYVCIRKFLCDKTIDDIVEVGEESVLEEFEDAWRELCRIGENGM